MLSEGWIREQQSTQIFRVCLTKFIWGFFCLLTVAKIPTYQKNLIVIISQYIQIPDHYAVCLKLIKHYTSIMWLLRWHSGKESSCQCRRQKRCRLDPWVGKEMATHSSTLAWEIPRTEEPDGLQFMGLQRLGHNSTYTQHMSIIFLLFFFFWLCIMTHRILFPRTENKSMAPALQAWSLYYWTAREVPIPQFFKK